MTALYPVSWLVLAALVLGACGKMGPPAPPGPPDKITYPKQYPAQ